MNPNGAAIVGAVERHIECGEQLPLIDELPDPDRRLLRGLLDPVAFRGARAVAGETAASEWALGERDAGRVVQRGYVRDIFGNPFRPVALDPTWLTPDVVALAERI